MITQKQIDSDFFNKWQVKYREARADMGNREKAIEICLKELEFDMELLGITGVEGNLHNFLSKFFALDKLQDEVALTIEALRGAGIQIWMLTGDKVETATCIAMSAGFKSRSQQLFFIKEQTRLKDTEKLLNDFGLNPER